MNCTDWNEKLHDHVDSALSPADARALEAHLTSCAACRAEFSSLRALRAATAKLPRELAPSRDLWPELEENLAAGKVAPVFGWRSSGQRPALIWKLAASLAILASATAIWKWNAPNDAPFWTISSLAGTPRVDSKSFQGESHLHVGQWLETDAIARAKVSVGAIGEVSLEPNSRLRLVDVAATDHRVELARGKMSALIWSPPRLFFVDTPSATAVDLGCQYTLEVADSGAGLLHVTSGYVALVHEGRETVIRAGQMCATRRGAGPGTPFVTDAPDALRRALDRFDFAESPAVPTILREILAQARAADAVTLWHLLPRVPATERGAVFDKLARDHAPPDDVTRAGIIDGDAAMLTRWSADLGLLSFANVKKKIP